ncbi:phage tail protein I [Sphingomonas sp. STIS6.2]|uniref:phage tail protein I n=1 Tax=Sphingomonas sp. STIS6.2 TaxID=1379700 RepID=UPI000D13FF7F|nr:phage tail protein I [Sphingomonas sp. STIS6.2]
MTNSLLPPNATRFERALEAGAARIVDVEAPADIDDPLQCPVELLPWLAWGLSVDIWDADWSEADKRAAVAGSIALHRRKGTPLSVKTVLGRFDQLAQLTEWHEARPRRTPHTFDIVMPMVLADGTAPGGRRATAAFAEAIIREVSRVKPLREHLTMVQSIAAGGFVGIQTVARLFIEVRQDLVLTPDTSAVWATYLQTEDGEPLQDTESAFLETTL